MSFIKTTLIRYSFLCAILLFAGGLTLKAQEYYTVEQIDQAKAKARATHLPIAWLSSYLTYANADYADQKQGSDAELTNLALRTLRGQAVIIFQNADGDLPKMPANVADRIETKDEGDGLPNGQHYTAPKIIYADPDLTTFFGCTVSPDLRRDRESAINVALLHIHHDPHAQDLINATAPATPASTAGQPAAVPGQVPAAAGLDSTTWIVVVGAAAVFLIVIYVIRSRRR